MITKSKSLTEKEYSNYSTRLTEITQEKNLLQKVHPTKGYQAHLSLPSTCEELLIIIKRHNEQIDNQIKVNLLNLSLLFQTSPSPKNTNQLITLLLDPNKPLPAIIVNSQYYQDIKNLITMKEANIYLYNYVHNLLEEEKHLTKITTQYQKRMLLRDKFHSFFKPK